MKKKSTNMLDVEVLRELQMVKNELKLTRDMLEEKPTAEEIVI